MRLMWLWVLLYALGIGFLLVFLSLAMSLNLAMHPPSGIAYDIGGIAVVVGLLTPAVGFLVCLAGIILLLIRRTVAAGRVVSLIGLGFYYAAASAVVAAAVIPELLSPSGNSLWNIVGLTLCFAVPVGLPGFFMTRTLRRAIKAEKIET